MAIVQPQNLNFENKPFFLIISGSPGAGKTTLALSAPNPVLFDIDDGISRVEPQHRKATAVCGSYDEFLNDIQDTNEYSTIIVDTGGELVKMMKQWAIKQSSQAAKDPRAMFGVVKNEFDRLIYHIRKNLRKNLIMVFHTTEIDKNGTQTTRLSCEGGAKDIVWTPADFGCHMFMQGKKRIVGFSPTEEYFAKGSAGITGLLEVPNPTETGSNRFLEMLFIQASSNMRADTLAYNSKKKQYDEVMAKGKALVDSIVDNASYTIALEEMKKLVHVMTSKEELNTYYMNRMEAIRNAQNNSKPAQ